MAGNSQAVIGVFDEYSAAESVARDLENLGVPGQVIPVKANFTSESETGEESGISGFFHRLFNGGHEGDGHGEDAPEEGGRTVVAVMASREQVQQAARLMTERGAVVKETANFEEDYRRDYDAKYAGSGDSFDGMLIAYEYGAALGWEGPYRGKNWDEIEHTVRDEYVRNNPASNWERMRGAVRFGWERASGGAEPPRVDDHLRAR